jgi:hypothetical protein
VIGGSRCVVFLSSVLSNGTMVSRKSDHVICMSLKILRREANGFKRVRLERSNPLKTSIFSMMKKAVSLLVSGQNLGGHWLGPVWSLESVFVVQYMHVVHFVCLWPRFLVIDALKLEFGRKYSFKGCMNVPCKIPTQFMVRKNVLMGLKLWEVGRVNNL